MHPFLIALASTVIVNAQVAEGITTVLLGADGGSPWPIGSWLEERRRDPVSLNLAVSVGHATVREQVMQQAGFSTIKVLVPDKQCEARDSVQQALAAVGGAGNVTIARFPVNAATVGEVSSDGGIGLEHPRAAGTFPRVLGRFVREKHWLTLPEAIRKMTSLPARRMGLNERGVLRKGTFADLVLFDPERVIDRATFAQPLELPAGIPAVFVNGVQVWGEDKPTGARPGRVLTH